MVKLENLKIDLRKGKSYAGLSDVFGGRLWFSISKDYSEEDREIIRFGTKRDCIKYIRENFTGEIKKILLSQVNSHKGQRAFINN